MVTYAALREEEITIYVTKAGLICFRSHSEEFGKPVDIFLSPRQARMLQEDLPDMIAMANEAFHHFSEETGDAEPSNP